MIKVLGVFLGRFAPLHKGHQKVIGRVISDFSVNNSLIIIGSSDSYNAKTPYTFSERKGMVRRVYPTIKVVGLPDINPTIEQFNTNTLKVWIGSLKKLENSLKAKFIFYGGSKKDLSYLEKDFETKVAQNRNSNDLKISATRIRKLIKENNIQKLEELLDPRIIPLAISGLKKYIKSVHKGGGYTRNRII